MYRLVILALALGAAQAVCPNACSGHGTCSNDDVCVCYQNWGMGDEASGDCSMQYCPFEYAFVDTPDKDGKFHKYMECSGKGICDRSTGDCECFEGYTGKGCQRTSCPNDCSGHGTCEYIEELTFGSTPGEYSSAMSFAGQYHTFGGHYTTQEITTEAKTFDTIAESWDFHKSMACVCDGGYIDVDCSRRMCPKGNDVFDTRLDVSDNKKYQVQNITLRAAGPYGNGTASSFSEFSGKTFALTFVSTLNESYTTIPINIKAAYENAGASGWTEFGTKVKDALKALPNKVIDSVQVDAEVGSSADYTSVESWQRDQWYINLQVTFDGDFVEGKQNLLIVEADKCDAGCTPKITGLQLISNHYKGSADITASEALGTLGGDNSMVTEMQTADYNNYECGRRGKCDYDSGICECFEGYTGVACGTQTALV